MSEGFETRMIPVKIFSEMTNMRGQKFWCNQCDSKIVSYDESNTGLFFMQTGHAWSMSPGEKLASVQPDYHMIVFAVCAQCLSELP